MSHENCGDGEKQDQQERARIFSRIVPRLTRVRALLRPEPLRCQDTSHFLSRAVEQHAHAPLLELSRRGYLRVIKAFDVRNGLVKSLEFHSQDAWAGPEVNRRFAGIRRFSP